MLSYTDSLKILKETNALIEGHFILSSGLHSSQYVQCAQLLSKPDKSKFICLSLAEKIKNNFKKIDIILSPAMGGVVIGYEIGRILNIESIFAERVNGEFQLRRDFDIKKNSKVLVVEDVITTGKSSLECSALVTKSNAEILGFTCIIDLCSNNTLLNQKIISQIKIDIPTYTKDNLPKELQSIPPIKPGSRGVK